MRRRIIIWNEPTMPGGQPMFAVIFEVEPRRGKAEEYLQLAASLRPELEKMDGFIAIERFASKRSDGRLLSLSIWRDEEALTRWRSLGVHRAAQQKGRSVIFADYRLRVGEITADSGLREGTSRQRRQLGQSGAGGIVTISEFSPASPDASLDRDPAIDFDLAATAALGMTDREAFASLYDSGKLLLLASWGDAAGAGRWRPSGIAGGEWRHRQVQILRDYGMFERGQAPQYYPPVQQRI
jgi:heme-degrading monooxygenase HmoA